MKIGIIGMGIIGSATANVFSKVHEIKAYDKFIKKYNNPKILKDSEVIFLCIPTPMKDSGEIDLSIINESIDLIDKLTESNSKKPLIVSRSTATPGTTDLLSKKYPKLRFASNPEFLREKTAKEDMENTTRIVIGANNEEDSQKLLDVYKQLFPNANYTIVNRKTAEMIKYSANIMLLGQITTANEIYHICQKVGIDYDKVKDAVLLDKRIGTNIEVPGYDGDVGFGGKCFPKDLNALIQFSKKNKYNPEVLESFWNLNLKIRKNKDWLNIKGATSQKKFE